MTETAKKRCRWPWFVLAAVLLLVAGTLAWQFRPLNATEQKLVGAWLCKFRGQTYRFAENRRYQFIDSELDATQEGSWKATDSSLVLRPDSDPESSLLDRANWFVAGLLYPKTSTLEWRSNDHLRAFGESLIRAPTKKTPAR